MFSNDILCVNPNYANIPTKSEIKFKTEICKNWDETGKCNYGKKCRFAHGKVELQDKFNNCEDYSRYKSKQCNGFHTQGYCPYGVRCLFIHEGRSVDEIKYQFMYRKIMLNQDIQSYQTKKRLPIFVQLSRKKALNIALSRNNEFIIHNKENI